jgi:glycosyltransferase involved in cell wall biosynthesis
MGVIIQSFGEFKSPQMAHAAERIDMLDRYIVAQYPTSYDGPQDRLVTYRSVRYLQALGFRLFPDSDMSGFITNWLFDQIAKRKLTNSSLFVGYSGSCLSSLHKSARNGSDTIIYRGAPHGNFFHETIRQELEQAGYSSSHRSNRRMSAREHQEYEMADYVWAPSEFVVETLREHGIDTDFLILPYGVDIDLFYPSDSSREKFTILYVGGVTPQKGVHRLIEGFSNAEIHDAELQLIGKVDDRLQPLISNTENITALGWVDQDNLVQYYQKCDVFVIPSLADGFGAVVLEAMASGCPVIATERVGAATHVTESNAGRVVPPNSPAAIAESLRELYANPKLRDKLGNNAVQAITEDFTTERREEQMGELFRNIISGSV